MEGIIKDNDLNSAILRYICQCHASGDYRALQQLGIEADTLDLIKSMTVHEAIYTSGMRASFVKNLRIDNTILANRLQHARREAMQQQQINELGYSCLLPESASRISSETFPIGLEIAHIMG